MDYRHELKHEISLLDMLAIRARLRAVCRPDSHGIDGKYHIRSLYFDDLDDMALRDKLNGVNRREKFRLRCYNLDFSFIRLEKKSKLNGLGNKQSAQLSAAEAESIIYGDWEWMAECQQRPLVRELYCKMRGWGLRPRTIVDYTREAFVYAPGNVRVTLDRDVRTGLDSTDFLNPACLTVPAGEAIILEVKWDAYLPDVIRDIVQLENRRSGAFSKYAACRIYG